MAKYVRKSLTIDGFFDIETEGWSTFVTGALLLTDGTKKVVSYDQEDDYIDWILSTRGTLWSWNGGKYDTLYVIKQAAKRGLKVDVHLAGQRIVCAEIGSLKLRDAAALIPMSLEKAAPLAGLQKGNTGLTCQCERGQYLKDRLGKKNGCGGYCRIYRGMPAHELHSLKTYNMEDCEVGLGIIEKIQGYAEEFNLDLCGTIGASAWATAKRLSDLQPAEWEQKDYWFARKGYFGGRVQVFRPQANDGFRYDINSSYPAALERTRLPVGKMKEFRGTEAGKAFECEREGIYHASVRTEWSFVPPLPVRMKDRIAYPTGHFSGIWTRVELQNAVEHGAEITGISKALVWESSEQVMRPFVTHVMGLRWRAIDAAVADPSWTKHGKDHPLSQWLKLYANSATGKLAQNPEVEAVVVCPTEEEIKICQQQGMCMGFASGFCGLNGCCPHKHVDACVSWKQLDEEGIVWSYEETKFGDCAHVQMAAYLTAVARVELLKQITADDVGGGSAIYCDTDSCYSTRERSRRVGNALGEWQREGALRRFRALAPKVYRYEDPASGKATVKAKGIPDCEAHWPALEKGEVVKMSHGVNSFRSAARNGDLFSRKDTSRHINPNAEFFGDRRISPDGSMTLPIEIDERFERMAA